MVPPPETPLTLLGLMSSFVTASQYAGIAQLVEHNLAKVGVAGSSPVSRSRGPGAAANAVRPRRVLAPWPSGKAEDCKSFIPSSNLGGASQVTEGLSRVFHESPSVFGNTIGNKESGPSPRAVDIEGGMGCGASPIIVSWGCRSLFHRHT
jgi:hypothetical protein